MKIRYKLGDVCKRLSSGKNITASKVFDNGLYPVYGGNGLRGYTSDYNFDGECAIIGRQGAYCGNVQFFRGKGYMTEHAVVVCANENANTQYLGYVLAQMDLGRLSHQAAQPGLSVKILSEQEIDLPSVETQNKIVGILSAYDSLIENNQKQIKLLEEAAQRLYKEWFVDLRFPGYETTPVIDGVPEGWTIHKMSEVCDTVGGGTPSTKVNSYYEGGNVPWVTPTDITQNDSLILLDTATKITEEGLKHSSAKMVPAETILMTSRASVGFFGICEVAVCTNQGFISCIPYDNNAQMYLLFNLINRVDEIRGKAGGSTYLEISKKNFRDFNITVPDSNTLSSFQKVTHTLLERERVLCKTTDLLKQARDRLLPKLMSGEIEI